MGNETKQTWEQDKVLTQWQQSMLSVENETETQPEVLRVGDTCIGTLGNFSASIGKAKSRKTFNLSAIVAAALSGGRVMCYKGDFPEDKRNILYVDTEQSTYHCQKVLRRILTLAGLPADRDCERLQFLALRKHTPEERLAIVGCAIYHTDHLGLVIIDGIRDLVYDINSPVEATTVISKLMQWTDERQLHLHTVLHQNKSDDNARGHIGTELNNKAETVIQIEKDRQDKDISVVQSVCIRAMDFDDFAFRVNDDALPELVADYVPSERKAGRPREQPFDPFRDISEATHISAVTDAFGQSEVIASYKQLTETLLTAYKTAGQKLNYNKVVEVIRFLQNKRIIIKAEPKGYRFNPDYHY